MALLCIEPGFVSENGDATLCALLEQIDAHGLSLSCAEECAEPSSIAARDSDAVIYGGRLEVETAPCAKNGTRVEQTNVHVGSPFAADNPGFAAIASSSRLRGNGDINLYGGDLLLTQRGIGKRYRNGDQDGYITYENLGTHNVLAAIMFAHSFIATHTPTNVFYPLMDLHADVLVTGNAIGTLYNPGGWNYVSDERIKDNVRAAACANCLDLIKKVEPILFEMGGKPYTGFSAQNIQTAMPGCVGTQSVRKVPSDTADCEPPRCALPDSLLTVRHGDILANAVGAIKALDEKLESALARISDLEGQLAALKGA